VTKLPDDAVPIEQYANPRRSFGYAPGRAAEPQFKLAAPRPGTRVRDYIAVDRRGHTIAGPFKSYSDAKHAAGTAGVVQFVRPGARAMEAKRGPKADPRAVAFFRKNAGGVVGREDEYARELAHAEQEATARGWAVEWHDDPEGWDSLGDIDPETVKEMLYAVLKDENGNVLTSLGSIVDPDRAYGRVVEAELALEALNDSSLGEARRRSASELPVIFRAEKSGDAKGEVTAVFPTLPGTGPNDFVVYAHMGQHSHGTHGWYNGTRAATPAEYASLLAELRRIYEQGSEPMKLHIVERFTRHYDDERRKNAGVHAKRGSTARRKRR
jgi:hypothetical protein